MDKDTIDRLKVVFNGHYANDTDGIRDIDRGSFAAMLTLLDCFGATLNLKKTVDAATAVLPPVEALEDGERVYVVYRSPKDRSLHVYDESAFCGDIVMECGPSQIGLVPYVDHVIRDSDRVPEGYLLPLAWYRTVEEAYDCLERLEKEQGET